MSDQEKRPTLDEEWAKKASENFDERVTSIARGIREMADQVEREARLWLTSTASSEYGMGGRHAVAAAAIHKVITNDMTNLGLERLIHQSSEADLAESKVKQA